MIATVITVICSLVAVLLKSWQDGQPGRAQEALNATTQRGRQDIENGNGGAVTLRVASLLDIQANAPVSPPDSNAGSSGSSDADRDTLSRSRLVALGIRVG